MNIILMAGGSGTRFWPISRERCPKQFLKIIGSRPLIEETYARIAPLADDNKIYIVIHDNHRALTEEIFKEKDVKILPEPIAKNTAPCIGLSLIHILKDFGDEPVIVLPADHYIGEVQAFQETIRQAADLVQKGGIATIGIVPTRPETGFGYIKGGEPVTGEEGVHRVDSFVEKPSLERATQFLLDGGYYWNAGIFAFKAQTMLDEIHRCLPELYDALMQLSPSLGEKNYHEKLLEMYQAIAPVSIDYGVMEKATSDIFVIPGNFPWSDVGSWQAIFELRSHDWDAEGNLIDGNTMILNCKNTFVHSSSERLISCLGLNDTIIVDTSDALMICHRESSQDIRHFIQMIKDKGLTGLL